jgi:hypothetical protein
MQTATSTAEKIGEVGSRLGLDSDVIKAACAVADGTPLDLLTTSGWLASGKDAVADGYFDTRAAQPVTYAKSSLVRPLKVELTEVFPIVGSSTSAEHATERVVEHCDCSADEARELVDIILGGHQIGEVAAQLSVQDGWDRTPEIRRALQFWGTDVRRAHDGNYWIDKALALIIERIAANEVLYFCDCRFPEEVVGLQSLGFVVVRLDVTRETQRQRLLDRDGLEPDPAAMSHSSETALDDFVGFDLIADNNGPLENTIQTVVDAMTQR